MILFLVLLSSYADAQYNGKRFSIGLSVFIPRLPGYFNPNSSDPVLRNHAFGISDIINPSVDFRYRITNDIIIGIGTEYMKKTAGT